jgi:uncharacterized protein (DUF885 family)
MHLSFRRGWGFSIRIVAAFAGCLFLAKSSNAEANPSADAAFDLLASDYIQAYHDAYPLQGVWVGWHRYDGKFVVADRKELARQAELLRRFGAAFDSIRPETLSLERRIDRGQLLATIERWRFTLESARSPWHDPDYYADALDLSDYIKRDFKPLGERVRDMTAVLKAAHALFAAARENLDSVLPQEFIENAIDEASGTADFLENDVAAEAHKAGDADAVAAFDAANAQAVAEQRGFVAWLKSERLPQADHSFALGPAGYRRLLAGELIDLSPEEILKVGLGELQAEKSRFAEDARVIDPSRTPAEVFKSIQADHPTAEGLIPDARSQLEVIRQFILDRKIVTIPSEVRATVAETLPPFRSSTFASMDSPGPFESVATEAYYYITPVDASWTAKQKDEWLTSFNDYTLDVVSIHETYPGHYVQFLAMNASKASVAEKVFWDYAFGEGWAHYCEQMVLEAGFRQPVNPSLASREELARAARYRLAQSGEALLRICRLCCSVKLHTEGMTVPEAARFFMDNCYYEERPARSEALRGTYDPSYLFYTVGKLQILKLRRDWAAQEGPSYSLQRFHDLLLSHGTIPVRLQRELLLRDPAEWPRIL